ncbi:hypothetical protein CVIRNUC_011010 [Coccomyxa viridis]|uniref:Uncharacterized protein n=1 Tax=Coccomyxa viridis TaxID=1274662 RepID=A0AAV1IKD7_9CHLO|nr:hypothetical protein CVIRNUC_011010 [Coccomyxa viridis]
MASPRHRLRGLAVVMVLYLTLVPCLCTTRRLLQDPGWPTCLPEQAAVKDAVSQFPVFQLPATISNLAGSLPQADSGPLLGEKVFSSQLPVSAVNLGLGANSFPGEQDKGLVGLVEQNITLFLQQTFQDKCDKSSLCKNITGDIWQNLLDDLTSYGQSSADATQNSNTVSKVNTTFYIVQPKGHKSIPSDLEKKIEDTTPSPTPDPSSQLMTKVVDVSSQVNNVLKKLTGFSPPPGGFSKVLEKYFGNSKTTSGAAAAVAGAAGG